MPRIKYIERKFTASSIAVIEHANTIISEYIAQGFDLTVRQLYYQFVSRDLLKNNLQEYKKLASIINDARLAGLIDWNYIQDRTRFIRGLSHWSDPESIIRSAASGYRTDKWARQEYRPEVWIEKDALVGVIEGVCNELDVDFFSCRGYTSQSEMWGAAQRLRRYARNKQHPVILHLGDHDPSGIDMSRDILDRIEMFAGGIPLTRLALNMDQVDEYQPPPNPAKLTDSRIGGYSAQYGDDSWELDALSPSVISDLIRTAIMEVRDEEKWEDAEAEESQEKERLTRISDRYDEVIAFLEEDVTSDLVDPDDDE